MKNYKLSMTTDILAPRIKHLTSENRALKNKVRELEADLRTTNQILNELVIKKESEKETRFYTTANCPATITLDFSQVYFKSI